MLGDKDQSLAALLYLLLTWNSPSPRAGSGELRTLSLRPERAACSTDLWVAGREMKGRIYCQLWAPERAQPGFGWRARVAYVPAPGPPAREPNCPFFSRSAYPVKSMLITAICGAPSLLTELGYSFSPILPLNCFLVKLYIGAYGLYCLLLLACGGPGKGESQTFLEAASCEGFELPGR